MTNYYKPITLSTKHKNLNWVNSICAIHDLQCQCDNPLGHTIIQILKQEPELKFTQEDKNLIQKCLTTGDHGDALDGFGDGELEALFAQDGDDAATATETG